ncbi:MAG TPA: thioredoxin domain-containing protein [Steroidobacteraceae bacterium]|nr:thioredoxin domain-containing protein [Steroidobacteraceae bacterium]
MQPASGPPRNRLAGETSPYLLQHARNPVDWYPWGPEALERARRDDKPILLSIGYSACHWCHVMAHESFEHVPTAALMNELFVNIKVDREERPDLDRIYQIAQQVLTQHSGGWPLTMFLTPQDQVPFFGGTYFPREPRHGMPAFAELLRQVAAYFHDQRAQIRGQNGRLLSVFASLAPAAAAPDTRLDAGPLERARAMLQADFDAEYGGFTGAPKFPHTGFSERLLRHWSATAGADPPDLQALYMATLTLTRMAEGGLYDHVGGGFARYSVDAYWMIPHFEKMLYDNGPLLALYADAATATGDALFRAAANGTADWVLREMQAPAGGFYSSLDADSEGEEGKFYVWDASEVERLVTREEYAALARRFGLDRDPNFEHRHWYLHAFVAVDAIARAAGVESSIIDARLAGALGKLFTAREARIRPGRDDKILSSWNGLMIRGLAIASRALGRDDLATSATRAVDFLKSALWRDGRLFATHKDGRSQLPAYLDDYLFVAEALLELLATRWRSADLEFAIALVEVALEHFEDRALGGFWFTADDAEPLIHRSKSFADEALPSGNGVAARLLGRLGHLLGEPRYLHAAERTLRAAWSAIERYPPAHGSLLDALEEWLTPVESVILRGPAVAIDEWRTELARRYAPRRMVFAIPDSAERLPPALAAKIPGSGPLAYLCRGSTCEAPIDSLPALLRRLDEGNSGESAPARTPNTG